MALHNQESISNLSDISGLSDMSDITSSTDLTEPRVCIITECSAPYGPACNDCAEAFQLHVNKRAKAKAAQIVWQHSQQDLAHWKRDWIESKNAAEALMPAIPSVYVQDTSPKEDNDQPMTARAKSLGLGSNLESASARSLVPRESSRTLQIENIDSRLSSCSTFSKIEVDRAWIDEFLEKEHAPEPVVHSGERRTSAIKVSQSVRHSRKKQGECPFCKGVVEDPRDQHIRKCEYAHREQEALDRLGRKQSQVGGAPIHYALDTPYEIPQFFDWDDERPGE